jgi:hypothetical protein
MLISVPSAAIATTSSDLPPPYSPSLQATGLLPTRFDRIELPLREQEITAVLSHHGVLWVGTTNGLFIFDGISASRPQSPGAAPTLYVKSIVGLDDGSVLVGTINGSLWRATSERLENLLDLHDRDEFDLVRMAAGPIFVAESYGRLKPDAVEHLVPGTQLRLLPRGFDRIATRDHVLFAASDGGQVYRWEFRDPTADPVRTQVLLSPLKKYPRRLQTDSRGRVWIVTDAGIAVLYPNGESAIISDGQCGGVGESRFQTIWLACSGRLAEYDAGWRTWLIDPAFGRGSLVFADEAGNLWLGGAGLWRSFSYARTLTLDHSVTSVAVSSKGSVWTRLANGAVESLDLTTLESREVLPPAATTSRFAAQPKSDTLVLHASGLWRLDDATQLAPPLQSSGEVLIASGSADTYLAERGGSGQVWRLSAGRWVLEPIQIRSDSGSGAACIGIDREGRVWVASASQVFARLKGGQWLTSDPIGYAPETKLNRWGVFWVDSAGQANIHGPWGYAVSVAVTGNKITTRAISSQGHEQPWLSDSLLIDPALGTLLGTDSGLFAERDGHFRPLGHDDERLRSPILALSGLGPSNFLAATELGLVQVNLSLPPSTLNVSTLPRTVPTRDFHLSASAPGLAGPPARNYELHITQRGKDFLQPMRSSSGDFLIENLHDESDYQVTTSAVDGLGRRVGSITRDIWVSLPLVDKRWFGPALGAALFMILGLTLFSARASAFALRTMGRKSWRLDLGQVDLALEIRCNDDIVLFTATARAEQATTRLEERIARRQLLALLPGTGAIQSLHSAIDPGWQSLPSNCRFAMESYAGRHIQLQIDDELIRCLWELTGVSSEARLGLRAYITRTVITNQVKYRTPLGAPRLRVLIVAPHYRDTLTLSVQQAEVRSVAQRFLGSGARVSILQGPVTKREFLEELIQCDFLHFAGHATHDESAPNESALHLTSDQVTSADLAQALRDERGPHFVFINACSSGDDADWTEGANRLYGLASPFIQNGAYFVGARWPILEIFAAEFADAFYRELLPRFGVRIWLTWLSGGLIRGRTLGQAMASARQQLMRGEASLTTWSAYLAYGDPTAALMIQ